jgi:hypothetical protein
MTGDERKLRAELATLKARYDCYAFAPEIYAVVRKLEMEIGWMQHHAARNVRHDVAAGRAAAFS